MLKDTKIVILLSISIIGIVGSFLYFYDYLSEEDIKKNLDITNNYKAINNNKNPHKKDDYIPLIDFWLVHFLIIVIFLTFFIFAAVFTLQIKCVRGKKVFEKIYTEINLTLYHRYFPEKKLQLPKNIRLITSSYKKYYNDARKFFRKETVWCFLNPDIGAQITNVLYTSFLNFIYIIKKFFFLELFFCSIAFFYNKMLYSFFQIFFHLLKKSFQGKNFLIYVAIFLYILIFFSVAQFLCERACKKEEKDKKFLFYSLVLSNKKKANDYFQYFLAAMDEKYHKEFFGQKMCQANKANEENGN